VRLLTAGVDVQKDRWVFEVVGWGASRESWSIDKGVIPGNTGDQREWAKLDALLAQTYFGADGVAYAINMLAIDSGFNTQMVYAWAKEHPASRVMATKGVGAQQVIVGSPSPVDITISGRVLRRGYKVWPIGVNVAKTELYGFLRLNASSEAGEPVYPPGYCHFPEYEEEFFQQLTSEQLVSVKNTRTGFTAREWQILPGRENHFLDCRVYARAAASIQGIDRIREKSAERAAAPLVPLVVAAPPNVEPPGKHAVPPGKHAVPPGKHAVPPKKPRPSTFFGGRGKPWL